MELMDDRFKISPVKVTPRDGSAKITIEHRIGRDAGFLSRPQLMDLLGLEKEFGDYTLDMQKKFRDKDQLKKILDEKYRILKGICSRVVDDYREKLEKFYGGYETPLLPLFSFVPVTETEKGLYLLSLVRSSDFFHMVGDPADNLLYNETLFAATKKWADLNARAEKTARALMLLPGINKDLKQRAMLLSQGKMPEKLEYKTEK